MPIADLVEDLFQGLNVGIGEPHVSADFCRRRAEQNAFRWERGVLVRIAKVNDEGFDRRIQSLMTETSIGEN